MVMSVASFVEEVLGGEIPVGVDAYDGSTTGPDEAAARIVIKSPSVLWQLAVAGPELGLARSYAVGDLDVEGDIYDVLSLREHVPEIKLTPALAASAVRLAARSGLRLPRRAPGEAHLRGRVHSKERDAAAIAHHYDVSNAFYRLFLGPSMAYTCAVWRDPSVGVDAAQEAKHELVSRKLDLQPGMRLLDVGCGWGGMAIHAAMHHGVRAVGVTLSRRQAEWGQKWVAEAGLSDLVEIRHQDYRDVDDGPYDAISSIGLIEHIGPEQLPSYANHLFHLLRPGGRLLNHGITRPPFAGTASQRRLPLVRNGSFLYRFVFPDGELMEVGKMVSGLEHAGFEARHMESLREHYALTCRAWVSNLERNWDEAVAEAGAERARVWRLYMAGSALHFESNRTGLHQVLAVRPDGHRSGMPLRPVFE
jgi:cyclopropane-fatty-acyl-phospholipid synthase